MQLRLFTTISLLTFCLVQVSALQNNPGGSCTGTGACSSGFSGNCAPNGFCGDDGATCSSDSQCYNYCGSDGICGGLGASCSTTDPFSHGQFTIACDTPTYTCNGGTCGLSASGSQRRRARGHFAVGPRSCRRETDNLCVSNGRAECIDVTGDFGNCGACGVDCGEVEGADTVECVSGVCVVASCRRGWSELGNACVRDSGRW